LEGRKIITYRFTLENLSETAETFGNLFKNYRVFAFFGPMGVGKTTFIKALCESVGVKDSVSSPTYSIINEYRFPDGKIYHMDLYRIKDEEEAAQTGVEDCLYSGEICLVEWPERAAQLFPDNTVRIEMDREGENTCVMNIYLPA
jgi:tRNA threonylcarbamoyladenosine biosynthesis protein TsaE